MLARELADAVGGDGGAVGVGLVIERGQGVDEVEVVGLDRLDEVVRAVAVGNLLREFGFVELGVVEGDGAGVDRIGADAGHGGDDGAGVHPAGEEGAQRHFGNHAQAHGFAQALDQLGAGVLEADRVVEGEAHVPILPGLGDGLAAADAQGFARAEFLRAEEDGARFGDVAEGEVFLDGQGVDAAVERRVLHQHLELGAEGERAVGQQRVEHRLDRQAVARHEESVAVAVVQREREHAAEALHAVLTPGLPRVDDDLGIAAGVEDVAQGLELGDEFLEVVDLAVEHHRHRAILVEQRLLAGGEVDDGKPPVRERDAGLEVIAALVRAAMMLHVVHALHQRAVEVAFATGVEKAGDAAHDQASFAGRAWRSKAS